MANVKLELSLCLTNRWTGYVDVRGSEVIVPHILKFGNRWECGHLHFLAAFQQITAELEDGQTQLRVRTLSKIRKILPHNGDRTLISSVILPIDWSILRLSNEYRLWICRFMQCNLIFHHFLLSDPNKDPAFRYHEWVPFLLLRSWAPHKYKTKGKIGVLCFNSNFFISRREEQWILKWMAIRIPPPQLRWAPDALVSASSGFYSDSKMCEILFICVVVSWWPGLNFSIVLSTNIYWDISICITVFIFPGEHS